MKKIIPFLILILVVLISCQQKAKVATVDINAEKAAITEVMDKQYAAIKARDLDASAALLTDDALILGTDPKEFWTKAQHVELGRQMFADTSLNFDFKPERRDIIVSSDGNSALVVEQTFVNFISPKIQTRSINHLVKTNGNWMIDFWSSNMIPRNEDLQVINKALLE